MFRKKPLAIVETNHQRFFIAKNTAKDSLQTVEKLDTLMRA